MGSNDILVQRKDTVTEKGEKGFVLEKRLSRSSVERQFKRPILGCGKAETALCIIRPSSVNLRCREAIPKAGPNTTV